MSPEVRASTPPQDDTNGVAASSDDPDDDSFRFPQSRAGASAANSEHAGVQEHYIRAARGAGRRTQLGLLRPWDDISRKRLAMPDIEIQMQRADEKRVRLASKDEDMHSVDDLAPWLDENNAARITKSADKLISWTRDLTGKLHVAVPLTRVGLTIPWHDHKSAFNYPTEKAATKANINHMRKAERCLDHFWSQVRKGVTSTVKSSLEKVLANRLFEPRQLWRTPLWSEPVQLPTPESTPPKPTIAHDLEHGLLHTSRGPNDQVEDTATQSEQKVKTRRRPAVPDPRVNMPDAVVATLKDNISKKAYKVFSALLPSTGNVVQ
ncbi:hypothetical protein DOTSEDRAFT_20003 [Dothistroma septosporum NZE10]|uniref:Uncharacterized protein n=1 Tax=Dothistroma septosporum (strain NZE10 / CBS 128990) TaxID=675120 RepID=N1Q1J6_DOTSN|nr:hypothetical protein DOTSEDRAFT_20003 [Dothistroma septosporum NZE10]